MVCSMQQAFGAAGINIRTVRSMRFTPVLMMGGIGNRLFQLARAIDLRRAGSRPVLVELDAVFGLDLLTRRLMGWSAHPIWLDLRSLASNLGVAYRQPTASEQLALFVELARIRGLGQEQRLNLPLSVDTRPAQIGYFQGHECVSIGAVREIASQLDVLLERPLCPPKNVMHIRGGDFAMSDRVGPEDVNKFLLSCDGPSVCVTNDPSFVRWKYPDLELNPPKSALLDFTILARALHIMPSNSTFCFWACAVAVLFGGAKLASGSRDIYWQMLSDMKIRDA